MPAAMPFAQIAFLGFVLVALAAFAVTLIAVSLYTSSGPRRPLAAPLREVTQAKRAEMVRVN